MKALKKVLLIGLAVFALVAVSAVAQAATTTQANTGTGGFNLPVVVPGANIIANFSLTGDGEVSNVVILGAPEDAGASTLQTGIAINYADGDGVPVATDVQAAVDMDNGVVTDISVESEDPEAIEDQEIMEAPEATEDQEVQEDIEISEPDAPEVQEAGNGN